MRRKDGQKRGVGSWEVGRVDKVVGRRWCARVEGECGAGEEDGERPWKALEEDGVEANPVRPKRCEMMMILLSAGLDS